MELHHIKCHPNPTRAGFVWTAQPLSGSKRVLKVAQQAEQRVKGKQTLPHCDGNKCLVSAPPQKDKWTGRVTSWSSRREKGRQRDRKKVRVVKWLKKSRLRQQWETEREAEVLLKPAHTLIDTHTQTLHCVLQTSSTLVLSNTPNLPVNFFSTELCNGRLPLL